ncbi:MAG: hypothetical protein MJZ78_07280 [Bacteroidales bacterium]|nr:hypothetical protein [Bacteroidales bacterium]
MANNPKSLKVRTALQSRKNKFDLSKNHITTANFMQYNVAYCTELIPKSSIKVKMETFARMAALPSPTFGMATVKNRAFCVPLRTIFPAWNDFITDTIHVNANGVSSYPSVPIFSNLTLISFLKSFSTAVIIDPVTLEPLEPYDFSVVAGNDIVYSKLSSEGKQIYKVFRSLGYKPVFSFTSDVDFNFSALRLLAFARIYCDYYANSAYLNDVDLYSKVNSLFTFDNGQLVLTATDLSNIFSLCRMVNYDSDYFTSAFDRPQGPNTIGQFKSINDVNRFVYASNGTKIQGSSVSDNLSGNVDQVPAIVPSTNDQKPGQITQYILDSLHALTDYMMRHQYVGSRAMDRYLARFGVKLSDEKLNRSIYIDTNTTPLRFGDVISTADTSTSNLGEYAGKGIVSDQGNNVKSFDFSTDEYSIFMVISTIIPRVGYYQGIDRAVLRRDRFDFFTPEFDALGTQPILASELYVSKEASDNMSAHIMDTIFGFTPRYADYKIALDQLTGDFVCDSVNAGKQSWHLMRMFGDGDFANSQKVVHSLAFTQGEDAEQYNRIFYGSGYDNDKFNVIYSFDVKLFAPMKSLYDTYDFHGDGQSIKMDINGNHIN